MNDSQLAAPAWVAAGESGAAGRVARLEGQIGRVVKGKPEAIRLAVVCLLARGHILIEDVPGVGKTTLAQTLARSLGLDFQRIQFTSDLLPSDIIGVSVYRDEDQRFEFVQGPIFANVVLADEINRASPKTQSALLEAMSERTVSVDRVRHILPDPVPGAGDPESARVRRHLSAAGVAARPLHDVAAAGLPAARGGAAGCCAPAGCAACWPRSSRCWTATS